MTSRMTRSAAAKAAAAAAAAAGGSDAHVSGLWSGSESGGDDEDGEDGDDAAAEVPLTR